MAYSQSIKNEQMRLNQQNQGKQGWVPLQTDGLLGAKTLAARTWKPQVIPTQAPTPPVQPTTYSSPLSKFWNTKASPFIQNKITPSINAFRDKGQANLDKAFPNKNQSSPVIPTAMASDFGTNNPPPPPQPTNPPVQPTIQTNTGDPNVRAQQIALNANGAGLKVDGILGPLTMAAIKARDNAVSKTPDGGIINPNTGGYTESPVVPEPTVPEPTPIVSPYETAVSDAEKAYAAAGQMTPQEEQVQAELDNLSSSFKQGYQGIEDKVIPMNFITGQQSSLEKRALNLAEPLESKLARLQAKRTSALEASKFALDRADKALASEKEAKKPISGTSFYDPVTGTFKTAPKDATASDSPTAVKEYEYAKSQGYTGTFNDFKNNTGDAGQSAYARERNLRNLQSVDTLMGQVNGWTTGFGSLLSAIPTTDARNFRAQLDTLKANITFGELTAMREASKTGGALGQVSDKEGQLLGAALGALDTAVTPAQFKIQLNKIKDSINRWNAEVDKTSGGGGLLTWDNLGD